MWKMKSAPSHLSTSAEGWSKLKSEWTIKQLLHMSGQNSVEIHPSENQMKNALPYTSNLEGMGDLVINAYVQR